MPNGIHIAPEKDRVQVYSRNPGYIQYRGEPLFLVGCNQGWTASLQDLDHDYRAEFDALHSAGGNLVRITPFIGLQVDDDVRLDPRRNNLPWKHDGELYLLDIDAHGGNPLFWERLSELVAYAYDRDIIISFEFWDLYSAARGPGGNLHYRTPPGDRWSAHPFAPGNSEELVGEHALPEKTHMQEIAFCKPVTEGGYQRALALQELYVTHLLDVLSPYPNVIYCMVNETSADKVWSDYWLQFTHRYFEREWDGAPHLAGEMPREYGFTENFTVEEMLDDPLYEFADISQYYTGDGLSEIQKVKANTARFRAYQRDQTEYLKPLTCMKIYNRTAPSVLWMRLLAGCATARYHRVINSGNYGPPAGVDAVQLQLDCVGMVAGLLDETGFQPWLMEPDDQIVTSHPGFDEVLAMCAGDRGIVAALFFSEETKARQEQVTLQLPRGTFDGFWLNPATGDKRSITIAAWADGKPTGIDAPVQLREVVLYLRRR